MTEDVLWVASITLGLALCVSLLAHAIRTDDRRCLADENEALRRRVAELEAERDCDPLRSLARGFLAVRDLEERQ